MLRQYFAAKAEHPGVLLAMRVGDFFEFYGEDAETAARALEITLTARDDGGNRTAMAGVPYHAVEKYLARLVAQGHKVALCDQLEDPKQARGLVKRGVTRVITPGTVLEDSMLDASRNNFLAALCVTDDRVGLATLDPSTGEFAVTEIAGADLHDRLAQEIARIKPAELLVSPQAEEFGELAAAGLGTAVSSGSALGPERARRRLLDRFGVSSLAGFGCDDKPGAIVAASMILAYAEKNGLALGHVDTLSTYSLDGFMRFDAATRRSLELTQNMLDGSRRFTLLSVLDATSTPMGARLLRRWIDQPLLDAGLIRGRLDAVGRLVGATLVRGDLLDEMRNLGDIERLVSRCATGLAWPRDLAALRASLSVLPKLAVPLAKVGFGILEDVRLAIDEHPDLYHLLRRALTDEPPHSPREAGTIREDYDQELDSLRDLSRNGKKYIAQLEAKERESTGIGSLKVGFNSVFGYYLEVSKSNLAKVPEHYIRKQTTANAERYITAELKEHESQVLGAEDKAAELEADLFQRLRARASEHATALLKTARAIAELDALCSFAEIASRRRYAKPEIVDEDVLEIRAGRHPVVECASGGFVPNDLRLGFGEPSDLGDMAEQRVVILTGPNMSGKSTYLRQAALIALMAQIGCFVPAESCRLGLCDRIFARIGAKDELAMGQSTFMVEMTESANILNHATPKSLVILDEVGRGTSTYDGMAIAWAMVEELAAIGCKAMFATHYHQLNALADQVPQVANFRVSVEDRGEDIVWSHKVLPGGTDRSYGIHVAKMAGVPSRVLARSAEILEELEAGGGSPTASRTDVRRMQLTLFESEPPGVIRELGELDLNSITPIEALKLLDDWKQRFQG